MRLKLLLRLVLVLVLLLVLERTAFAQDLTKTTRLLRFPTTNGSQIVFCYAGQLYTVPKEGGIARRLTSGPGYTSFSHFSPDGKQIAFTSQYDGNTEVYVMPAEGGEPKRITTTATLGRDDVSDRMGPNNIVMTWANTTPQVVFRTRMNSFNSFIGELYTAGLDGDLPKQLPVPRGGFASFSPDDSKMVYNRVFREFRTWKHYRGGMADDVWMFDFKTGQIANLTNDPSQDVCPMWGADNRIYFASDRDGRMNLFSTELTGKDTKQLTTFNDYDIKFPTISKDAIVFEQAGYIWRYDLASGKAAVVPIEIKEDLASGRSGMVDAGKHVQGASSAPDGQRAIVVARGDLYSVPAKDGAWRNLSRTSNAHERDAVWSPDGKWIAYNSDATGENELYVRLEDGKGEPTQLTRDADTYFYQAIWSPDSKKLMWADRKQRLRFLEVASKAVTQVAESKEAEIRGYDWSPDSNWIAYTVQEENGGDRAYLYSMADKKSTPVTDEWYSADNATFSDDGKYLMITSGRDFRPLFDQTDFNNIYRDLERVYLITLAKETENPLGPRSDEVFKKKEKADDKKPDDKKPEEKKPDDKAKEADKDKDKDKAKDKKPADDAKKDDKDKKEEPAARKPVTVKVDVDGIGSRLIALDIPSANYTNLRMINDRIFYMRRTVADDAKDDDGPDARRWHLCSYSLEDRKETVHGDVSTYEITFNGKKMLVKIGKEYAIIDLPKDKIELKDDKAGKDFRLKLSGLDMKLDRRAEWMQIYNECWRHMRDFFYAPNMHGVDWKAMKDKYGALVPSVNHRNDLTYLIGELIGELNIGHAYTGGGERPDTPRIKLGLLGAVLSRDPASKAYKIERILPGENWDKGARSPLTAVGMNVKAGDYILAVNGTPVSTLANIYDALIGTADKQVVLRVNSKPSDDGAREITVIPIADESPLYYRAWVQKNVDDVTKKTNGEVGYIHIPDMGQEGLNEFTKQYFPQLKKKGLIVDVRGNGGGFVSPLVIDRLRRSLVMVSIARNGTPQTNPPQTFLGPMVALCNEFSASDGDIFPFRFKANGLGKLIGKRTWGGVVGIRNSLPLTDGGSLNRPEFAPYAKDGKSWVMEGHGTDPDIVVDNDPAKEFKGEDEQLNRAIQEIQNEMKTKPGTLPPVPPYPNKNPTPPVK